MWILSKFVSHLKKLEDSSPHIRRAFWDLCIPKSYEDVPRYGTDFTYSVLWSGDSNGRKTTVSWEGLKRQQR